MSRFEAVGSDASNVARVRGKSDRFRPPSCAPEAGRAAEFNEAARRIVARRWPAGLAAGAGRTTGCIPQVRFSKVFFN